MRMRPDGLILEEGYEESSLKTDKVPWFVEETLGDWVDLGNLNRACCIRRGVRPVAMWTLVGCPIPAPVISSFLKMSVLIECSVLNRLTNGSTHRFRVSAIVGNWRTVVPSAIYCWFGLVLGSSSKSLSDLWLTALLEVILIAEGRVVGIEIWGRGSRGLSSGDCWWFGLVSCDSSQILTDLWLTGEFNANAGAEAGWSKIDCW